MSQFTKENLRALAIFLPQYHPIPENDQWWGPGFTEWTNVSKAKPLFKWHYQPHLPSDLGFVDLRLAETREKQAALARSYGIHGFCYYHYWFAGKRLLERPVDEILRSGKPDFPFCLNWANENWSRRWDGSDQEILIGQNYGPEDDLAHIRALLPYFADRRYIRVEGKPVFLVYRTELLPDPKRTAEIWREESIKAGVGDLYLIRVEGFEGGIDPGSIGFDAAVEFAPDWRSMGPIQGRTRWEKLKHRLRLSNGAYLNNSVYEYDNVVNNMRAQPRPSFKRFRSVFPSWDNACRRVKKNATIFRGSTPAKYQRWLEEVARETIATFPREERFIFINAWNEWGEGCHLEPDLKHGRAYLEATWAALSAPR